MAKKIKVTRFSSVEAPDGEKGKKVLLIGGALVLVLVGFVLGKALAPDAKTTTTVVKSSAIAETRTGYGPFDTKGVVPKEFDHSTQGAIAAASTYIGYTPSFYLLKDKPFDKAISQVSSKAFEDTLYRGMTENRIVSQSILSEDTNAFYREIPLGYGVVSQTDDEVIVNVWSMVMLVAKPDFNGNTQSKLHTMKLVWEDGDWKIDEWSNAPGPTPRWQSETELLTVDDFIAAISPFTGGYDYAPSF